MKIDQIDKNFAIAVEKSDGMRDYSLPAAPFDMYGMFYDEKHACFARMDLDTASHISDGVAWLARSTAGGRVRFCTNASKIELTAAYRALGKMPHMTLQGSSGFLLAEKKENGDERLAAKFIPAFDDSKGFHGSAALSGQMKEYILYFPLYNDVSSVTVSLNEEATIKAPAVYRDELPILYYGSSITQGGCAARPDTAYQALISKWNNMDFINLGFSGNAKGEPLMADYLANTPCSLFVCDYDHNAPNAEHLQHTHYALYEAFRRVQKKTPILFVTKPDGRRDGNDAKRVRVIRDTYQKAKAAGDKHVYFLDGKTFYPEKDSDLCAVDGCHPTDLGFYFMAKKLYAKMIKIDDKFR